MTTVSEKVKLLDTLKEGVSYVAIARHYNLNDSTVCYIREDEQKIRKMTSITFNEDAKRVVTPHNKRIVKMEML